MKPILEPTILFDHNFHLPKLAGFLKRIIRLGMPMYKDEPRAVRVYTVCDESKYLIVRNVPSLGCGDDVLKLFSTYGEVEECKPMDAEDCEQYTDVYWIKFRQVSNARFAKRKLDDSVFLGNRLQISYAPEYENPSETKEKLEGRRKEVLARLNPGRSKRPTDSSVNPVSVSTPLLKESSPMTSSLAKRQLSGSQDIPSGHAPSMLSISFNKEYFPSESMNRTVQLVRDKLNKIQSSAQPEGSSSKRARTDNRRRI